MDFLQIVNFLLMILFSMVYDIQTSGITTAISNWAFLWEKIVNSDLKKPAQYVIFG